MASADPTTPVTTRPASRLYWLVSIVAVSLCVVVAIVNGDNTWLLLAGFLGLTLGRYIAIFVHEMGHVAAGRRAGLIFQEVHVGPFAYCGFRGYREIYLNGRRSGGLAQMMLPNTENPEERIRRFFRGGPVASAWLAGVLAAAAAAAWVADNNLLAYLLVEVCFGSLFSLISGWLPFATQGAMSDALVLHELEEKEKTRDSIVASYLLGLEYCSGLRPRDWNPELVERLLVSATGAAELARAQLIAFYFHSDLGDSEKSMSCTSEAERILSAEDTQMGVISHTFWLIKAFDVATKDSNYAYAKHLRAKAAPSAKQLDYEILVLDAAIEAGEGKPENTEALLHRATKVLERRQRRTGCSIEPGLETIQRLKVQAGLAKPA